MLLKLTGLVPLYPLIGCIINGFFGLRIGKNAVGLIAAGSVGLSFLTTLIIFIGLVMTPVEERVFEQVLFTWIAVGDFTAEFGFQVDPLSMDLIIVPRPPAMKVSFANSNSVLDFSFKN